MSCLGLNGGQRSSSLAEMGTSVSPCLVVPVLLLLLLVGHRDTHGAAEGASQQGRTLVAISAQLELCLFVQLNLSCGRSPYDPT